MQYCQYEQKLLFLEDFYYTPELLRSHIIYRRVRAVLSMPGFAFGNLITVLAILSLERSALAYSRRDALPSWSQKLNRSKFACQSRTCFSRLCPARSSRSCLQCGEADIAVEEPGW